MYRDSDVEKAPDAEDAMIDDYQSEFEADEPEDNSFVEMQTNIGNPTDNTYNTKMQQILGNQL